MNPLEKNIMRRVYTVWFIRKLTGRFMLKMYIVAVLLWQLVERVSLFHIWHNSPEFSNFSATTNYFVSAFSETELIIQAVIVVGVVLVGLVIKDAVSNFSSGFYLRRVERN